MKKREMPKFDRLYFLPENGRRGKIRYRIEDGDVDGDTYDARQNATPADEWLGRVITWGLEMQEGSIPDGEALSSLLDSDQVQALFDQLDDETDIRWDGNNNSGTVTEHGQKIIDDIQELLDGVARIDMARWSAGEWFEMDTPDVADMDDEQLKAFSQQMYDEALDEGAFLYDIDEYLEELREEQREDR